MRPVAPLSVMFICQDHSHGRSRPPTAFDALTFDCYGTLIDWEAGILAGLRPVARSALRRAGDDELLERSPATRRDRGRAVPALPRGPGRALRGPRPSSASSRRPRSRRFGGSVADWPAFPNSAAALRRSGALPPRRHHELRRRPLRDLEPRGSECLRLGRHGAAGRVPTSRATRNSRSRSSDRRPARADPARHPEPLPRPRRRPSGSACERLDRPPPRPARGRARRRRPTPARTRRSRTWPRSPPPRTPLRGLIAAGGRATRRAAPRRRRGRTRSRAARAGAAPVARASSATAAATAGATSRLKTDGMM